MVFEIAEIMKTTNSPEMVRWQFRLKNRLLTIGVAKTGAAGYSVVIRKNGFVQFIRLPSESFFSTLRAKLHWGKEAEA